MLFLDWQACSKARQRLIAAGVEVKPCGYHRQRKDRIPVTFPKVSTGLCGGLLVEDTEKSREILAELNIEPVTFFFSG